LLRESGAQERATQAERYGGEERLVGARGAQERATQAERYVGEERLVGARGEQERATTRVSGEEQRKGIQTSGSEQRTTDLQQEMFRRYKENRDYEQAQRQYRA
jgi:hypothetical protein